MIQHSFVQKRDDLLPIWINSGEYWNGLELPINIICLLIKKKKLFCNPFIHRLIIKLIYQAEMTNFCWLQPFRCEHSVFLCRVTVNWLVGSDVCQYKDCDIVSVTSAKAF